jgi:hypothetical protein
MRRATLGREMISRTTTRIPVVSCFALLGLAGCPIVPDYDSNCDHFIVLPHTAFRLDALNSPYDDWNSCAPWSEWKLDNNLEILFSSNRGTQGGTFDLTPMSLELMGTDSSFSVQGGISHSFDSLLTFVNTSKDELGPSFWFPRDTSRTHADSSGSTPLAFTYARGESGSHDIHVMIAKPTGDSIRDFLAIADWRFGKTPELLDIELPAPINTSFDEAYATWSPRLGRILFHSNRSGKYRIWEATVPLDFEGPFRWLRNTRDSGIEVREIPELASSDGQERCPYLVGNTLYFVSDRSGGQGGFDVYRSRWNGSIWSTPENLGPTINSSSDEYRPFALPSQGHVGSALIFSSNRPGGQGGFDLYMAGL